MPRYTFQMVVETEPQHLYLVDDDAAWSELVTLCGEILRDMSGNLPPGADLEMRLSDEAGRRLARLRIGAERGQDSAFT